MRSVTWEDSKAVSNKLVSVLHPKAIITFGSVAKKGYGNDLDLFIVFDENGKNMAQNYIDIRVTLKKM